MNVKNIEQRSVEFRSEGNIVSGVAIVFDSPSADMGFTEYIDREAITEDLINNSDIFALLDHSFEKVLARSKNGNGSLHLEVKEDGLHFSYQIPNTIWGQELREHINRSEIEGNSFGFVVKEDEWSKDSEGKYIRHIKKIDLVEISAVYMPAYPQTEIAMRGLESFKKEQLTAYKKDLIKKMQ